MKEYLSHTRWDCKYHMVFIPKRRKKTMFGVLRRHLGRIFRELAEHKESEVVEGHLMPDHVLYSAIIRVADSGALRDCKRGPNLA